MWAATPILIDFSGLLRGPLVGRWQPGFEQQKPTRLASCSINGAGKSSLMSERTISDKAECYPVIECHSITFGALAIPRLAHFLSASHFCSSSKRDQLRQ